MIGAFTQNSSQARRWDAGGAYASPMMSRWYVHLTRRDEKGDTQKEFVGAYLITELPAVLEQTLRRALGLGAGVQVLRERSMPGLLPATR